MKNKGIIIAIVAVIAVIAVIGIFAVTNQKEENVDVKTQEAKQQTQEGYQFQTQEKTIPLGVDFASLNMPKETNYYEVESCAFEGLDKEYTYDHYVVTTYPEGGTDKVKTVYFLDSEAQTTEGVKIGDTYEKMVEVYGSDYENADNQYTYTKGKTQIIFLVEEDSISDITYNYVTE